MFLRFLRIHKFQNFFPLFFLILLLGSCSGQKGSSSSSSGGSSNSSGDSSPTILTGQFLDSAVEGIDFLSGSQQGTTDNSGSFSYEDGKNVRFSIGSVIIGEGTGASSMTPVDLISGGDLNHRAVINIARFLQTLDADGDPSNGINISSEMRSVISASEAKIQFDVETSEFENSNSAILNLVTAIPLADGKPREIKGVVAALSHFQNTLASTSSTPLASLSGEVTNNSGVPLQGVMVSLMRDIQGEAALLKMTTTNQDGYYEFPKVLIGDYTIIATNSQSVERAALTQATVSNASSITLQTLQLTPTGSLSGQITLEGTAVPEGIMVYLLGTNYVAMTDDQGNYTFTGVPVGTYALMATFDGFESQKQSSIEINSGDVAKMTALHLISLNSPLRKGAIQGVVDQASAPLSAPARLIRSFSRMIGMNRNAEKNNSQCIGCGVKAWPTNGASNGEAKTGTVDENGNFEVPDLEPGIYDVAVSYTHLTLPTTPYV